MLPVAVRDLDLLNRPWWLAPPHGLTEISRGLRQTNVLYSHVRILLRSRIVPFVRYGHLQNLQPLPYHKLLKKKRAPIGEF